MTLDSKKTKTGNIFAPRHFSWSCTCLVEWSCYARKPDEATPAGTQGRLATQAYTTHFTTTYSLVLHTKRSAALTGRTRITRRVAGTVIYECTARGGAFPACGSSVASTRRSVQPGMPMGTNSREDTCDGGQTAGKACTGAVLAHAPAWSVLLRACRACCLGLCLHSARDRTASRLGRCHGHSRQSPQPYCAAGQLGSLSEAKPVHAGQRRSVPGCSHAGSGKSRSGVHCMCSLERGLRHLRHTSTQEQAQGESPRPGSATPLHLDRIQLTSRANTPGST